GNEGTPTPGCPEVVMSEPVYQRKPPLSDPTASTIAVISAQLRTSSASGKKAVRQPGYRGGRYVPATAGMGILLLGFTAQYGNSAESAQKHQFTPAIKPARAIKPDEASTPQLEPLKVPDAQLEPVAWSAL